MSETGITEKNKYVQFYHGALSDSYENQANEQGYTLGKFAEFADKVGFGLTAAHIHGVITDGEYSKILQRFQKKILVKNLKKLEVEDERDSQSSGTL